MTNRVVEELRKGDAQLGSGALDECKHIAREVHASPFAAIRVVKDTCDGPGGLNVRRALRGFGL